METQPQDCTADSLSAFVIDLLNGRQFCDEELAQILGMVGYSRSDNYCCIVVKPADHNRNVLYLNISYLKLESQFKECVAFLYKGDIVMVVNLDRSGILPRDIPNRIGEMLRDGLFHAGLSFMYWISLQQKSITSRPSARTSWDVSTTPPSGASALKNMRLNTSRITAPPKSPPVTPSLAIRARAAPTDTIRGIRPSC
jgi:hypothetical protein